MIKSEDFSYINLTEPEGIVQVLKDKWFWCVNGDPKFGVVYKEYAPQCNSNKQIAERFPLTEVVPNVKLVFIKLAFVPYDLSDY